MPLVSSKWMTLAVTSPFFFCCWDALAATAGNDASSAPSTTHSHSGLIVSSPMRELLPCKFSSLANVCVALSKPSLIALSNYLTDFLLLVFETATMWNASAAAMSTFPNNWMRSFGSMSLKIFQHPTWKNRSMSSSGLSCSDV